MNTYRNIYMIGIGGIGMSALARYFRENGTKVSGYDKTQSSLTKKLVAEGIDIHYEDDPSRIPDDVEAAVYTPAVPATLNELQVLRQRGIPVLKRAEMLGRISQQKRCIAIAGTHGKTTTAAITTHLLRSGGVDTTAFIGGLAHDLPTGNFASGTSDWMIVEADEFDRSFLHLSPEVAAILSLDADHLDIYGSAEQMKESGYEAFVKKVHPKGMLLLKSGLSLRMDSDITPVSFGISTGDCRAEQVSIVNGQFVFDYVDQNGHIEGLTWQMPGRHNVENAVVAIAIARHLGVADASIRMALQHFKGIWRRADWVIRTAKYAYLDDYAHHPTELRAIIAAVRELMPNRPMTGIFQPHLYSRTKDHAGAFAEVLNELDTAILLPIYPARENPMAGVTSAMIAEQMDTKKTSVYLWDKAETLNYIKTYKPSLLLTLGAGDIDRMTSEIKSLYRSF